VSAPASPPPPDVMMAVAMSRQVRDGDWVSHGASVPLAGAGLLIALEVHVRDVDVWIQGCVSPTDRSLVDALIAPERLYPTTAAHMSQTEIINFSLRGASTFQFLRPLQIDVHGNVNVSVVERDGRPPLRFHGVAVGDAINAVRRTCLYVTEHTPRVFAHTLAFRTGAGHDDGSDWRPGVGLHEAGPASVITPLCVLGFDEHRRLEVRSLHPGASLGQVREQTGFELEVSPELHETPPPSDRELEALERVDPDRIRLLEFRETRDAVLDKLAGLG
jgi:glutaconate CoA-transferase subunit B